MNNTNRALNRFGIALFGIVLFVGGIGLAVSASNSQLLRALRRSATDLDRSSTAAFTDTRVVGTRVSWILPVIIAVAIVLIVLLLVAIFRQGHGRTGRLLGPDRTATQKGVGGIIVDSSVAEKAIAAALKPYPGFASVGVTTYSVKGVPTLSIGVSARRGVSPRDIRDHIESVIESWDATLGVATPVLVRINGGFVSRTSKAVRVSVN